MGFYLLWFAVLIRSEYMYQEERLKFRRSIFMQREGKAALKNNAFQGSRARSNEMAYSLANTSVRKEYAISFSLCLRGYMKYIVPENETKGLATVRGVRRTGGRI